MKVKSGSGIECRTRDLTDVDNVCDLLKMVKDKVQPKLDAVPLDALKLYKCEADAANSEKADTPNKYTNRY